MSVSPSELLDLQAIRTEMARRRLLPFVRATMPDYSAGWHHRVLCEHLDRFARSEIRRLMVFMPPRHGKSELVSRRLPAFLLGKYPDDPVIATSYSAELASRMNRDVQRIIDLPAYASIFPGTRLWGRNVRTTAHGSFARNSDLFEIVNRRGSYRSAGVGGGITGMGFKWGIIDDPIKNREEGDSPTYREAVWEWYTSTFYTRRSTDAGILLTTTRWNEDDLAGRLLKLAADDPKADQWTVLKFPAVATDERHPADPRKPGEPLWPEKFPLEELEKTKAASAYEWAALYQQDPRAEGGTEWDAALFPASMWFDDWPRDLALRVISLDPSKGKDAKHGDYSALIALGVSADGATLWVEADMARRPTTQIVADGRELARRWPVETGGILDGFGVEANAFQELLADEFLRQSKADGFMLPIYKINNSTNKNVRIRRLTPHLTAKNIRFRATPGTRLLVRQMQAFPVGDHDDGPDALEMAIRLAWELWKGKKAKK